MGTRNHTKSYGLSSTSEPILYHNCFRSEAASLISSKPCLPFPNFLVSSFVCRQMLTFASLKSTIRSLAAFLLISIHLSASPLSSPHRLTDHLPSGSESLLPRFSSQPIPITRIRHRASRLLHTLRSLTSRSTRPLPSTTSAASSTSEPTPFAQQPRIIHTHIPAASCITIIRRPTSFPRPTFTFCR